MQRNLESQESLPARIKLLELLSDGWQNVRDTNSHICTESNDLILWIEKVRETY